MGFWKFSHEGGGGSKTLEIQVGGGLNMKNSSAGVILADMFTYFPPDINDNLSSFTGSFNIENVKNKTLKNEP